MANKFLETRPAHTINLAQIYPTVSDNAARTAMLAAVEEYESLQKIHRDFGVVTLASEARAKLEAAGIATCDDAGFRTVYLERRDVEYMDQMNMAIDGRIVARLEAKATPIVIKIRKAALAEVEKLLSALKPTGADVAERFGMPPDSICSPFYSALKLARDDLKACMDAPVDLKYIGPRRGALAAYFAKPF